MVSARTRSPNDARTVSRVERTRPKAATGSSSGRANSRRIDEKSGRVGRLLANLNAAASNPLSRLRSTKGSWFAHEDINRKAQAAAKAAGIRPDYKLTFWGCMVAGAVSRRCDVNALHLQLLIVGGEYGSNGVVCFLIFILVLLSVRSNLILI